MKNLLLPYFFLICLISCKKEEIRDKLVAASCGQCQFNMSGKGCDLAVKIGADFYYVEGVGIDDFGDAHASDGFVKQLKKQKSQELLKIINL